MKTRIQTAKEVSKLSILKWVLIFSISSLLGGALFVGLLGLLSVLLPMIPPMIALGIGVTICLILVSLGPAIDMAERELRDEKK